VNNFSKNLALWIMIGLVLVMLFNLFQGAGPQAPEAELPFSDFLARVESGEVGDVDIQGERITGHFTDGRLFSTYAPDDPNLVERLHGKGVRISASPPDDHVPSLFGVLVSWFPMLLLIAVWIFFMRQMQSGGGKALGFGKSRARLLTEKVGRVTFEDVAGIDEAKQEVEEVVEPAKPCWPAPSPARPTCPSSRSRVPTSWKCSSESVQAAYATCSIRVRRTPPASSSSTRSTRSVAIAAPASAAATTSASRPSISSWWRWTASRPTKASS
jgi:hypothetical protein